jgi:hypothetical protein
VDWDSVEGFLKDSGENVKKFKDRQMEILELDLGKLKVAIKERLPEEIIEETNNLLRLFYANIRSLSSKNAFLKQIHPNYDDVKITIRACYLLNDIILAKVVGEKEIVKERNELEMILRELSEEVKLKIDVAAIQLAITKLGEDNNREGKIEEIRSMLRQQLKELLTE